MRKLDFLLLYLLFFLTGIDFAHAQQLAFPGAEGFGRFTTGGRGGAVYEVTNLNDAGPGSLRDAINKSGPRTIVFRVAGTIHLESDLRIRNGNVTIAGQTAPGGGIAIKGRSVVNQANNVIIRYIRFRPGDISGAEPDAIWGRNQRDIIIDHCSMSWAVDETSSFYDNANFTMQWCLLSESLYRSTHVKGNHGYGGIWGGQGATFHHNMFVHQSSRTPRFNGSRYSKRPDLEFVDYRNNVNFNWGNNSAYGGEEGNQNMVNNYYKAGPATSGEKRYRILDAAPLGGKFGRWYVEGNYVEGYPDVTADNWARGVQRVTEEQKAMIRVHEPFPFAPVSTQTAEEAYLSVLDSSGAILPRRDPVDTRIVNEVRTGTVTYGGVYGANKGMIDSQETVGGWPELMLDTDAPAPEDTDHDGMPDAWELQYGLNPDDPADRNEDWNNDGYTNLEEYLNGMAPIEVQAPQYPRGGGKMETKAFPNPFSEYITFEFKAEHRSRALITVADLQGNQVATVLDAVVGAGIHQQTWDGTGSNGSRIKPGVYLVTIRVANDFEVKRVVYNQR